MSVKMLQNMINQVREIIDQEFGLTDDTGMIIVCSNESRIGQVIPEIREVLPAKESKVVIDGITFNKIFDKTRLEFVAFIYSDLPEASKYISLISINAVNLKAYYDEKFDKVNFLKSILFENTLPGDTSLRIKELHINYNAYRTVFVIRTQKNRDTHAHEVIQGLFPNKLKDFIIILDNENTVLIKELKSEDDCREIEKTAKAIVDTLNSELMIKVLIGVGSVVGNITEIGRSFKEAQTALQVGGIFESDKAVFNYNRLGIGRLIYQLPQNLCKLFLDEVFKPDSFDSLDSETIHTIQKFFENNLNVSETSRQLYVHRNTLVYRLDKIQKITGLDIRKFDDAIIFKVAMLVKKYIDKDNVLN
ncbi:MAG: helix-turn-helix domain-containing protein [Bacillota bacterium]|nr:helix-turn-helix domain-containing protein [Bacillota bacterium]